MNINWPLLISTVLTVFTGLAGTILRSEADSNNNSIIKKLTVAGKFLFLASLFLGGLTIYLQIMDNVDKNSESNRLEKRYKVDSLKWNAKAEADSFAHLNAINILKDNLIQTRKNQVLETIHYYERKDYQKQKDLLEAQNGSIKLGSTNAINLKSLYDEKGDIIVECGVTMIFNKIGLEKGVATISIGNPKDKIGLYMKSVNDKLFITTKVFDREGRIIFEIDENNWSINPNNFYKRNYDNEAIEVIDMHDNVVFSLKIENKKILISGIYNSGIGSTIIYQAGENLDRIPNNTPVVEYNKRAKSIKRIFKYSGKEWLGKRLSVI